MAKGTWSWKDVKGLAPKPEPAPEPVPEPEPVPDPEPVPEPEAAATEKVAKPIRKGGKRQAGGWREGLPDANAVDKAVGAKIRELRTLRGLSQERLGAEIGLTFQQIQKYERGGNRIGAGRLAQIAEVLDVPVSALFDGAFDGGARGPVPGRKVLEAAKLLDRIDEDQAKNVLALLRAMAGEG